MTFNATRNRFVAILLTIMMFVTMIMPAGVLAAEKTEPPTTGITSLKYDSSWYPNQLRFYFNSSDASWFKAITNITTEDGKDVTYTLRDDYVGTDGNGQGYEAHPLIQIDEMTDENIVLMVEADGYKTLKLDATVGSYSYGLSAYTVSFEASSVEDTASQDTPSDDSDDVAGAAIPPTADITAFKYDYYYPDQLRLFFNASDQDWVKAITSITSEDDSAATYTTDANFYGFDGNGQNNGAHPVVKIENVTQGYSEKTTFFINADGYKALKVDVTIGSSDGRYGRYATVEASVVEDTPAEDPLKDISADDVTLSSTSGRWIMTFPADYVAGVSDFQVNGESWEATSYGPYTGGKYYPNTSADTITTMATSYTVQDTGILKSGDVITIKSEGYKDLVMTFVRSNDSVSLVGGEVSDPYTLALELRGSFESAIVGQTDYDGVSAATGAVSSYKNSNATVYVALTEGDATDKDWTTLEETSIDIDKNTFAQAVKIEAADGSDKDSGMSGSLNILNGELTLSGTPKEAGTYNVTVTLKDSQGRTATSNPLTFTVYDPQTTKLAGRLVTDNFVKTQDGKYMWQYQEPWTLPLFGSNVDGEKESVRVPKALKAWMGSGEDGPYAEIGYAIPFADVQAGKFTQTLYIPSGCNLTMTNMKIHSSVRIVVEDGGKLTLRRSSVEGVVDVQKGGTFSMNYNNGTFLSGAAINGQLILEDGAILENAAIVSHTNYIAETNNSDRNNSAPVVVSKGDVTVKGDVFIRGDEAGTTEGQTGLLVKDGTLTLEDGATLAVYGGAAKTTLYHDAGTAIQLDNGNIAGNGKLIAVGGAAYGGDGGNGVTGNGTISTTDAFIQGTTALSDSISGKPQNPGTAVGDGVKVTSKNKSLNDGTSITLAEALKFENNDPLDDLYWNASDATPDLDAYSIPETHDTYVLMNIPYDKFYAAELNNNVAVDIVSSATKAKPRTGSLSAGSYHANSTGDAINGVTYAVKVDAAAAEWLTQQHEVTDSDSFDITVNVRGKENKTTYTGADALYENPDYSYYVLSEEPANYKELTLVNGQPSFSAIQGNDATVLADAKATVSAESSYGDYQINVSADELKNVTVYGIILEDENHQSYGLRHIENIWLRTNLAFSTGHQLSTHGCALAPAHYQALEGKSVKKITYITNQGLYEINTDLNLTPYLSDEAAQAIAPSFTSANELKLTLPADMQNAKVSVYIPGTRTTPATYLAEDVAPVNGKVALTASAENGTTYTVKVTSDNFAPATAEATYTKKSKSHGGSGNGAEATYTVTTEKVNNGSLNASMSSAISGVKITVKATADKGYSLDTLTVTDANGKNIAVSLDKQTATFTMPASNVTVKATFKAIEDNNTPADEDNNDSPFVDVSTGDYFYKAVVWGVENGITSGSDTTHFAPNGVSTRAQAVTMLWREAGEPAVDGVQNPFTDVSTSDYFYKAVLWAVDEGIVSGTSATTFSPDMACSRAHIVSILHRAAGEPAANGNTFVDVASDAYYASAVNWAVAEGITAGVDATHFAPDNSCTRAQIISFLYRQNV